MYDCSIRNMILRITKRFITVFNYWITEKFLTIFLFLIVVIILFKNCFERYWDISYLFLRVQKYFHINYKEDNIKLIWDKVHRILQVEYYFTSVDRKEYFNMQTNLLIAYLILGVLNLINIRKVFYPQIYTQDIRESSFFS